MTCFSIQKTLFAAFALCLATLAPMPVNAQEAPNAGEEAVDLSKSEMVDSPIVIELYTSSDCSACIFADRMLYDAMKDKQVIALSCHVKDATAMSADGDTNNQNSGDPLDPCVFRHWAFAAGRGSTAVTLAMPAFVFNGQETKSGSDLHFFNSALRRYHYSPPNRIQEAMVRWKDKDTISIHLPKASERVGKVNASVWLVRYKDMAVERLDEGINKGRVLRFSNIVQDITHIAKWHGAPRVVDVDVTPPQGGKDRGGYVVLAAPLLGDPYLVAGKLADYPVAADLEEEAAKRTRAKEAADSKPAVIPSENQPVNTVPKMR